MGKEERLAKGGMVATEHYSNLWSQEVACLCNNWLFQCELFHPIESRTVLVSAPTKEGEGGAVSMYGRAILLGHSIPLFLLQV